MTHLVALAAGVLTDHSVEATIDAAARAEFRAVGLWLEPEQWPASRIAAVRGALAANDLIALDAEVLRMRVGPISDLHRRTVEIAAEVGARNLLVIAAERDLAGIGDAYAALCELGATQGVRIALEFMLFSGVRTLAEAKAMVAAAQSPAAALLVDSLHLDRAGSLPADVAALPPAWLPYAQLCDAPPMTIAADDDAALRDEALNGRLQVGEGVLPLGELLDALPPGTPMSIELRSRALRDAFPDPVDRARAVAQATTRFLRARGTA